MSSEDPLERLKAAVGKITGQDMAVGKVVAILDCGDQAYPQMLAAIERRQISHSAFHLHLPHRRRRNAIHRRAGKSPSQRG